MKSSLTAKLALPALFVIIVLIFSPAINQTFFQDDFWLLHFSQPTNITSMADLLKPLAVNFHYRPLAFQGFYYPSELLFGINAKAYHLVALTWLLINTTIVYLLFGQLGFTKGKSWLGAFLYGVSATHYMTQFWLAAFNFTQGSTFLFLSFLTYLKFMDSKKWRYLHLSLAIFIVGTLYNELVMVLPILIFMYQTLWKFQRPIKSRKLLSSPVLIYFFTALGLFFVRWRFVGFPHDKNYSLSFSPQIFSTFRWYTLRTLNWPEGIKFVPHRQLIILASMVFLTPIVLLALNKFKRLKPNISQIIFGFSWFIVAALPFYFLPEHLSAYYLQSALLGLILIVLIILNQAKLSFVFYRFVLALIIIGYISSSFLSIQGMNKTHWVSRRAIASKDLISTITANCQSPNNQIFAINATQTPEELSIIAHDQLAAQVICHNERIQTIFIGK